MSRHAPSRDGRAAVHTHGEGEGGYAKTSLHGEVPKVQELGHEVNVNGLDIGPFHVPGGPEVFQQLDEKMISYAESVQRKHEKTEGEPPPQEQWSEKEDSDD